MRLKRHLTNEVTIKQMISDFPTKIRNAVKSHPFDSKVIVPILKKLKKDLVKVDMDSSSTYTYRFKSGSPELVRAIDVIRDLMKVLGLGETTTTTDVDTTPTMGVADVIGMTKKQQKCPEGTKWDEKKKECVADKKMAEENGCSKDEYW